MAISGKALLLDILADEGVRCIFGNPGTTELPLIDELSSRPEFRYILALQENSAVAMADGYAQASGTAAFVNLHTTTGLGGGMGNLVNAMANRTPLVVTAGQQDQRHRFTDPLLAGDLVGMAKPVSKWQYEVRTAAELGPVLRRAFTLAVAPPSGPVFVSLPMDVLDDDAPGAPPPRSTIVQRCVADGLPECAALLAEPEPDRVALVVGEEVASSGALVEVTRLAEMLGCMVFGAPFYNALGFPTDHPLWNGPVGTTAQMCRERLAPFSRILYIGCQVGYVNHFSAGPALPPEADLLHLSADPALVGRTYPTRLGLVGDVRSTLRSLLTLLEAAVDTGRAAKALDARRAEQERHHARLDERALSRYSADPMHPMAAIHAVLAACPAGTIVVDEAITASLYLRGFHRTAIPGSYLSCRGGGLGWGMPAAVGVKLARPDHPVVCVVGDGAAMYSIQSLYSAVRHDLDVLFVVINNRRYRILRDHLARPGTRSSQNGRFVAMDLEKPPIDYVSIASGMGLQAAQVAKAADVGDAARLAFDSGGSWLLELPVAAE